MSSNISERSHVKQMSSTPSRKLNNFLDVKRPNLQVASCQKERLCQRLPRIHSALSSIQHVMDHVYGCEKCQRGASDIEEKMYLCKFCSRRSLNDRHICLQCYENSDHIDCALTLIDCG